MSRSLVVDERYRLQPFDLQETRLRVVIQGVSFQGLEEITPVLHFDEAPVKHLALDEVLRRELIAITQSSLCEDWIGRTVELRPIQEGGEVRIGLAAPGGSCAAPMPMARLRHWRPQQAGAYGQTLLLVLVLALLLAAVSLLENSEQLWQTLLDYLR